MPRRRTHRTVGVAAGAVVAAVRTDPNDDGLARLLVALGGGIGASFTYMLPDSFEPATSFNHRKFFHSVAVGATVPAISADLIRQWESHWRLVAADARVKSSDLQRTQAERLFWLAVEAAAWVLGGVLSGAVAAYVSHLVLDLGDPSGLPLLGLALNEKAAPV